MDNKKNTQYKMAASLICGNMVNIEKDVKELVKGDIDYIHFDVMDGVFVPRYGLLPELLKGLRQMTDIPIDVHMMVANPEPYIKDFLDAGANIITIHPEATPHLHRMIKLIKNAGGQAGIALNPATSLHELDYIMDDIDLVMLMAINPGIVGHKLIPKALEKIVHLKEKLKDYPDMLIEIDGGVTPESSPLMIKAGANMLVCGTGTIYKPPATLDDKIREVRGIIDKQLS